MVDGISDTGGSEARAGGARKGEREQGRAHRGNAVLLDHSAAEDGEPLLGFGAEMTGLAAPEKIQTLSVKGVVGQDQSRALLLGEATENEIEIEPFVAAVEFVADDGMTGVGEVDSQLMLAAGAWPGTDQREWPAFALEAAHDFDLGLRGRAVRADAVFDGHGARLVLAERRVDEVGMGRDVSVDDREVAFGDRAGFPNAAEFTGGGKGLGDDDDAAGVAIETVDQAGLRVGAEVEAHAADEARIRVALGRMADEPGGLVDHKQVGVFVENVEQQRHVVPRGLSSRRRGVSSALVKEKSGLLPMVLMLVFALTRLPGMLPQNFSAVYALMFCAGVYFAGRIGWGLPFGMMLVTDLGLNLYYQFALGLDVFTPGKLLYLGGNYLAYAAMLWLGRRFNPKSSWIALLGGGVLGAILFYLITNTIS